MKNIKKAILVITLLVAFSCTPQIESIKCVAILTLSGSGEIAGNSAKNGIELSVKELNNEGGIDGKQIEVIFLDSKSKSEVAINQFELSEEKYKPLFYISNMSFISVALKPYAEKSRLTGIKFR